MGDIIEGDDLVHFVSNGVTEADVGSAKRNHFPSESLAIAVEHG